MSWQSRLRSESVAGLVWNTHPIAVLCRHSSKVHQKKSNTPYTVSRIKPWKFRVYSKTIQNPGVMMSTTWSNQTTAVGSTRKLLSVAIAASTIAFTSAGAQAQLEEVIVTAQKKQENLQDVAIAITAFSSDTIRNAGILNMQDVTAMTPSFSVSNYNPTTPAPYIRGVGTNSSSVGDDSSVGVFIDEVYAGRAGAYSADMFDVERIEVLRGPQGTLYGRNVAGGAMNIITNNPSEELEGRLELTAGDYDLFAARGMISGPLVSDGSIRGRLAVSSRQRDGHVDNILTGNELKDEDNVSARGKLAFEVGESAAVLLSADYSKDDLKGPAARATENLLPTVPGSPTDKVALLQDGSANRDLWGISAKLTFSLESGTLTSITAYRENDYDFLDDTLGDWAIVKLVNEADEESKQFSQEVRFAQDLDKIGYTVGAYYFSEKVDRVETFDSSAMIGIPGSSRPLWDASNDSESISVFGELNWYLTERTTLIAGGRYTEDDKDFDVDASNPDILGFLVEPYSVKADDSWSEFSPKLGVEFQASDDTLLYATWAEGYKSGGFNGLAASESAARTPFDSESVANYEVGIKADLLDKTLRVNAAIFYSDYSDLQNFDVDLGTFEVITATADAEMKGVELEVWYSPIDGLDLFFAGNVLDTEYTDFAADPDVEGNDLMRAPETSGSVGAQYRWPVGNIGTALLRCDVTYTDEMFFTTDNSPDAGADSYTLINARASFELNSGWELSIWGKNLGDEDFVVHNTTLGLGDAHPVYGSPRMWGATAAYAF
jgi:iron complex outermembrane receptor protein